MPVWPCAPRRVRRSFITRRHAAFQQEFQPMAVVSPTLCSVKQALSGKLDAGSAVTVRGWVRTRRDSKAGLSFVNVTDGSRFDPIQAVVPATLGNRSEEHTSELQSLMRISYAVFCLKKKKLNKQHTLSIHIDRHIIMSKTK